MPHARTIVSLILGLALAAFALPAMAGEARSSAVLPVHAGPGNAYAVIDRLAKNEVVEVVRCTYWGRWCYIEHKGPDGWVLASYLVGSAAKLEATPPKFLVNPFFFERHVHP